MDPLDDSMELIAKLKQQQNQTETSKTTSSSSTTSANATLATSNKDSSSEEGYVSAELAQAEQSASELLAKLPPESPLLQAVEVLAKEQQQRQLMQQQSQQQQQPPTSQYDSSQTSLNAQSQPQSQSTRWQ